MRMPPGLSGGIAAKPGYEKPFCLGVADVEVLFGTEETDAEKAPGLPKALVPLPADIKIDGAETEAVRFRDGA
jgi:hypothetical protein